jgi:L-ascorbate metabolism protein UlaG (beta-lactamase superfamily)
MFSRESFHRSPDAARCYGLVMADGALADHRTEEITDRIVFLGHAAVLIELDGVRLLTDPLLRGHVAHLRRQAPPVTKALFADPDAVLISHLHHDHLDLGSLRLLGRDVPLIVPVGAGEWMRRRGFVTVKELDVGEVAKVATLAVTAVQAHHDGRRLGGPRAATLGYVVNGRRAVYFAGDTELFAEMVNFPRALDVALLPVAGWGPTLGPGHMDPLDAARAVQLIEPRVAIPVHWGTLLPIGLRRHRARLGDPPRLFAEHVASLAPGVEVRILSPGQGTEL